MVRVMPVAEPVAALDMPAWEELATEAMVVPTGMSTPVIDAPTSTVVKSAVADVTVEFPDKTPSVTSRQGVEPKLKGTKILSPPRSPTARAQVTPLAY